MVKRLLQKTRLLGKNSKNVLPVSLEQTESKKLSKSLEKNLIKLKETFSGNSDVIFREFNIGVHNECVPAVIIFIDGMVNINIVNENIIKALMVDVRIAESIPLNGKKDLIAEIEKYALSAADSKEVNNSEEIIEGILSGDTILLVDGYDVSLKISARGWESRGVTESNTEAVVRGPREGYTETLRTNTVLLRRKIKSKDLIFEGMKIGRFTKTDVCIAYIRGIANEKIVDELKKRLSKIDIDGILESGYIEAFIEDSPFSIFPTIGNTEKPDITAAKLLEGRVAIFTDGTPIVLTLPYLFVETIQNSEDYYSRPWHITFIRWIRFSALISTVFLPAIYIAGQSYHHEMIPTSLLITMAAAREGIPFPVLVEIIIMAIIFEVLREAGVRMPKPVGQAVSIVGALVLGEAAVSAGIVSAPAVIVIAFTGISGFLIYSQNDSITIMRFFFIFLAGFAGLFGILLGVIFVLIHMAGLRSFGVPYLAPIATGTVGDLKDVVIRVPLWMMRNRPSMMGSKNIERLGAQGMPKPPKDE
ncbi:MAG: spore germination protein [Eubacteriales bacterium]